MSLACRVQLPDPPPTNNTVEYANWQSGQRPTLRVGARSLAILWVRLPPRSFELISWSKGQDACLSCRSDPRCARAPVVRIQPGSLIASSRRTAIGRRLTERACYLRSVGVSAAHLRGKQEDRVQFPDRPLNEDRRAAGPMGRRLTCNQVIGVRFPGGPLSELG